MGRKFGAMEMGEVGQRGAVEAGLRSAGPNLGLAITPSTLPTGSTSQAAHIPSQAADLS